MQYLEKAQNKLKSANILYKEEQFEDAITRIYYCIFHLIVALLRYKNVDLSKHSHNYLLQQFRKAYINSQIFLPEIHSKILMIKNYREIADYAINEEISKNDIELLFKDGNEIYSLLTGFISQALKEEKNIK